MKCRGEDYQEGDLAILFNSNYLRPQFIIIVTINDQSNKFRWAALTNNNLKLMKEQRKNEMSTSISHNSHSLTLIKLQEDNVLVTKHLQDIGN